MIDLDEAALDVVIYEALPDYVLSMPKAMIIRKAVVAYLDGLARTDERQTVGATVSAQATPPECGYTITQKWSAATSPAPAEAFFAALTSKQEPLGAEFSAALEPRETLYVAPPALNEAALRLAIGKAFDESVSATFQERVGIVIAAYRENLLPGYPPAPAELCVCANIDCGGFYCRGGDDATPLHPPTTEGEPK